MYDSDLGRDDKMGRCAVNLFQYAGLSTICGSAKSVFGKERAYELVVGRGKGKRKGVLDMEIDFVPTLGVNITCVKGRNLPKTLIGKNDPYLLFEVR